MLYTGPCRLDWSLPSRRGIASPSQFQIKILLLRETPPGQVPRSVIPRSQGAWVLFMGYLRPPSPGAALISCEHHCSLTGGLGDLLTLPAQGCGGCISSRWCLYVLGPNPENVIGQIVGPANTCFTSRKWKCTPFRGDPSISQCGFLYREPQCHSPCPLSATMAAEIAAGSTLGDSQCSCVPSRADSESQGSRPCPSCWGPAGTPCDSGRVGRGPLPTVLRSNHCGPQGKAALGAWTEEMALT